LQYLTISNIIIILSVLSYFIQIQFDQVFTIIFGLNYLFFKDDLYWQLLTTIFLHGSLMHLAMNMIVLFQIGNMIESNTSKLYFFFLYFVGGIITSLFSIYLLEILDWRHNIIGASGAISVLVGCFAYYLPQYRKGMIVLIAISSFAPFLVGISVAWYSHIIGFILGYFLGTLRDFVNFKLRR